MSKMPNSGRIWLVFVGLTFVGMGVFGRIVYIQTVEHDKWQARGEQFSTSVRTIEPARGQILADDGSLLATSVPVYDLRWDSKCEGMRWDDYFSTVDTLCQLLGKATDKSSEGIRRKFDNARQRGHRGALIARNIPFTAYKELRELPFVKLGRYKSGLVFERRENRRRPFGKLAARTVGIDREQQRVGIERAWNEELSGVEGQQLSRKVAGNQWMPVTDDYLVDPVEGLDVVTTLNLHLQDVATTALERQLRKHDAAWGTVIVCEVQTGHIQAISNLTRHESTNGTVEYWEDFNHAIGTAVEPGSTFKLATLLACMEEGMLPTDSVDTQEGEIHFHGKRMRDSNYKDGGHGEIDLLKVFEVSSNIGSALAVKQTFEAKPSAFTQRLEDLGVTTKTGIRYVGEAKPKVKTDPSARDWTGITLTQMAIGYELTQTPLQTLTLYNAIANNGKMMRPQLVQALQSGGETVKTYEPFVLNPRICSASDPRRVQTNDGSCVRRGRRRHGEAAVQGTPLHRGRKNRHGPNRDWQRVRRGPLPRVLRRVLPRGRAPLLLRRGHRGHQEWPVLRQHHRRPRVPGRGRPHLRHRPGVPHVGRPRFGRRQIHACSQGRRPTCAGRRLQRHRHDPHGGNRRRLGERHHRRTNRHPDRP